MNVQDLCLINKLYFPYNDYLNVQMHDKVETTKKRESFYKKQKETFHEIELLDEIYFLQRRTLRNTRDNDHCVATLR